MTAVTQRRSERQRRAAAAPTIRHGHVPRRTSASGSRAPRTAPTPTPPRPACTAAWQPSPAAHRQHGAAALAAVPPNADDHDRGRRAGAGRPETAAHAAHVRGARAALPAGYPRRHTPGTAQVEPPPAMAAPRATS
jgi:hypothetical protein